MTFLKDLYNAWHNDRTLADQREYNRQIERGSLDLKRREVEALEKIAAIRAEVELPTADDVKGILKPDWLHGPTIERCAQVAENLEFIEGVAHKRKPTQLEIAAAIRALKEERR